VADRGLIPALVVVVAAALATACVAETPTPGLVAPERVGVSIGLQEMAIGWMGQYRAEVGVPPFDLDPLTVAEGLELAEAGDIEILVSAAPPPEGWFATPITREALAVAVNLDSPLNAIAMDQLASVFSGSTFSWSDLGGPDRGIELLYTDPADDLAQVFQTLVLRGLRPAGHAHLLPHPRAVRLALAKDPDAIGFLPSSSIDDTIRAIRVDGILPGPSTIADDRYPLLFTIYATAPEEPQGSVRDWLVWLQGELPAP
jgi:phosphate transport system substrate-binding protein